MVNGLIGEDQYVEGGMYGEVSERVRGGTGGALTRSHTTTADEKQSMIPKRVRTGVDKLLTNLKDKCRLPESVLSEAKTLFEQHWEVLQARSRRPDKLPMLAAACFHFASRRLRRPITVKEIVAVDSVVLKEHDINLKVAEIVSVLSLGKEEKALSELLHRDLCQLYLQRLSWDMQPLLEPILAVAEVLKALRLDGLTREEEIIGAILLTRRSAIVQDAIVKNPKFVGKVLITALQYRRDERTLIAEVSVATRFAEDLLRSTLIAVEANAKRVADGLGESQRPKRPREEETVSATTS